MQLEPSNAYFDKKINLLKQCTKISEQVLGSLQSEEELHRLVSQREDTLLQLKQLEETCGQAMKNACSTSQNKRIDEQVTLLLAISKDAAGAICATKEVLLEEIKDNKKRQQIANYDKP